MALRIWNQGFLNILETFILVNIFLRLLQRPLKAVLSVLAGKPNSYFKRFLGNIKKISLIKPAKIFGVFEVTFGRILVISILTWVKNEAKNGYKKKV
jgi:hypothetical protein